MATHGRRMDRDRVKGMTAIELLCATVLASLLMATTLGLLTVATKPLSRRSVTPRWQRELHQQLRWDLAQARQLTLNGNSLELRGYGSTLATTGAPTHEPCQVNYVVTGSGEESRLVREEIGLSSAGGRPTFRTTVGWGISRLEWAYPDLLPSGTGTAERALHPLRSGHVPDQVIVRVYQVHDIRRPWFQERIVVR